MTGSATKARQLALRLLGYRGRSERELRDRLAQKGFGNDIIAGVIEDLKRANLINDRELAEQFRRYAIEHKRLGFGGTRKFLLGKGIDRETVEAVVGFDEESEVLTIQKLAARKLPAGNDGSPAASRKLWAFFMRRGFAPASIRKALRTYHPGEEEES